MNLTEHMTNDERMRRIGQLLAKGITLMLMREAEAKRNAELQGDGSTAEQKKPGAQDASESASEIVLNDEERRIVEYLKRVGKASPRDMQQSLELSKATLFRRLSRLVDSRLLVRSGSAAAIRYRLATKKDCCPEAIMAPRQKPSRDASASSVRNPALGAPNTFHHSGSGYNSPNGTCEERANLGERTATTATPSNAEPATRNDCAQSHEDAGILDEKEETPSISPCGEIAL